MKEGCRALDNQVSHQRSGSAPSTVSHQVLVVELEGEGGGLENHFEVPDTLGEGVGVELSNEHAIAS
mgnify:CR=1 FL=1